MAEVTSGKSNKVGVFVCGCRGEISDKIDMDSLVEFIKNQPNVSSVKIHEALCSSNGQEFLLEECKNGDFDYVLIAACTPKTYETIIRKAVEEAGINKYLYEQANIREQCAWILDDKAEATKKAKTIIASGLARAVNLEPLEDIEVEITQEALVIGGGVAGLQAASDIANAGFKTYLIEKTDKLGGRTYELSMTFPTHNCGICCIQSCKTCVLTPKLEDITRNPNLEILLSSEVTDITGGIGNREVTVKTPEGERKLNVGVIILATGSKIFDPSRIPEYNYEDQDVITSIELEHLIVEQRKSHGTLKRPSDGKIPKTVNFIQCVGSRDEVKGNPHCSLVCCTYAIGQATEIKKRYPDTEVYIHYIDLRGPYRGFEEFYEDAKKMGVKFVRGRVAEVKRVGEKLVLKGTDLDLGNPIEIESDLIILSVGQEAREASTELAQKLHLPLDVDGFIKYFNPMLTPEERRGIFLAGCVQGPKGIRYSIEDARLAANNAITLLRKQKTNIEGKIAVVDEKKCVGCGKCEEGCEFDAAKLKETEDGSLVSSVDPLKCHGCGACSAGCCNKAISIRHYKREQIIPLIEAAIRGECA
ncbi:CoB--CoM heterodisulfide reductase iron-sulfur subunit A family protein [[Eubacterium] cellulosolvens]